MRKLSGISLAVLLVMAGALSPAQAGGFAGGQAATDVTLSGARCRYSLAEYGDYAKQLAVFAEKSRALAEQNPIYLSDVQYYAAELATTQDCIRSLTPFTAAAR
ncbi:MAG TPA: hypothetical protein VHA77_00655 [Xanthobacteraceae bacterium]|jgi:hypothetical protein|nr:hypothetical protein [Xanthobacteraceae bacterium]